MTKRGLKIADNLQLGVHRRAKSCPTEPIASL